MATVQEIRAFAFMLYLLANTENRTEEENIRAIAARLSEYLSCGATTELSAAEPPAECNKCGIRVRIFEGMEVHSDTLSPLCSSGDYLTSTAAPSGREAQPEPSEECGHEWGRPENDRHRCGVIGEHSEHICMRSGCEAVKKIAEPVKGREEMPTATEANTKTTARISATGASEAAGKDALLASALQKIADNYGGCHCDHGDASCCERVGEFCPHCIAELALAGRAASPAVLESSSAQAAQGDKGWVSEPDWPTEPRNASYRAGLRDAQKAFTEWKGKVISYESVRPSAPQVAGPSQIADAVIAYLEQHGHESHTRDGIRDVVAQLFRGAPAANVTGEQFLARRGFADSRNYSSTQLGPLLEEYARGGAPSGPHKEQKLDITPLVQKWFPEIDPFQARAVSLAIDVSAACSAEPQRWRDVKVDGLPRIGQWCCISIGGIVQHQSAQFSIDEGMYFWEWADESSDCAPFEVVTHWQPLPSAPKSESL